MNDTTNFKVCLVCQTAWPTRDAFINDAEVGLIGYQANFVAPERGLFLFNHSCNGTLSIAVDAFADLYAGPVFTERKTGSDECPGYCLHQNNLRPCPATCECAYVREILQLLSRPEKNPTSSLPEPV
ncbi:hypothetical protein [Geopsychrobacter electrodiphilus]|uniref:hypothetical protein n=1 Tax=Geopsychrobacter electrodiphilus TaxID=225196 RepID=UPI0003728116|nr:hypothetical protein [Geopsychrobacter electrodiphilus]